MSVDNVDPVGSLQIANASDHPCEKERARSRKPKPSGQRQIAKPFRMHAGFSRVNIPPIDRLYGEDGILHSNLGQGVEGLRDKATGGIVVRARIERC
jgi:hypothetical protein